MKRAVAENVKVVVRVRPLTKKELANGDEELVRCVSDRSVQVIDPTQQKGGRAQTALAYQFERCFAQATTQEELFEHCGVKDLLDHVLDGYSATVFAYGPTGSGKTFSVTGRPDSIIKHGSGDATDGVVIRSVEALFDKIRAEQKDGLQFKVRASCVEIYNESIIDLIKSSRSARGAEVLPVKFDPSKGAFFVHDLSYGKCPSEVDLLRLYMKALRNRSVASHELNRDSSRSHALFTVYVDSMVQNAGGHISMRHGKITFVDLAGSERLKDTKSEGATLRETGSINKSLFTLGKVIASLCDRKKAKAPYRDSKLTQLLMDSIGGTSLTIMLACISPAASHLQETMRTLDYAIRAKNIKNKPVVLLDPQQNMLEELRREIETLRAENRALKEALQTANPDVFASLDLTPRALLGYHSGPNTARALAQSAPNSARDRDRSVPLRSARTASSSASAAPTRSASTSRAVLAHTYAGGANEYVTPRLQEGTRQGFFPPVVGAEASAVAVRSTGSASEGAGATRATAGDSARIREDYAKRERELLAELESNAKYSYFDNARVDSYRQAVPKVHRNQNSNTMYDHHVPADAHDSARARGSAPRAAVKSSSSVMHHSNGYIQPHQRTVRNEPSSTSRSKSRPKASTLTSAGMSMLSPEGDRGRSVPKQRGDAPSSERDYLKELDRLSKFSYFDQNSKWKSSAVAARSSGDDVRTSAVSATGGSNAAYHSTHDDRKMDVYNGGYAADGGYGSSAVRQSESTSRVSGSDDVRASHRSALSDDVRTSASSYLHASQDLVNTLRGYQGGGGMPSNGAGQVSAAEASVGVRGDDHSLSAKSMSSSNQAAHSSIRGASGIALEGGYGGASAYGGLREGGGGYAAQRDMQPGLNGQAWQAELDRMIAEVRGGVSLPKNEDADSFVAASTRPGASAAVRPLSATRTSGRPPSAPRTRIGEEREKEAIAAYSREQNEEVGRFEPNPHPQPSYTPAYESQSRMDEGRQGHSTYPRSDSQGQPRLTSKEFNDRYQAQREAHTRAQANSKHTPHTYTGGYPGVAGHTAYSGAYSGVAHTNSGMYGAGSRYGAPGGYGSGTGYGGLDGGRGSGGRQGGTDGSVRYGSPYSQQQRHSSPYTQRRQASPTNRRPSGKNTSYTSPRQASPSRNISSILPGTAYPSFQDYFSSSGSAKKTQEGRFRVDTQRQERESPLRGARVVDDGESSYQALMRDMEESRKRAEAARAQILARKMEWAQDFGRDR